MNKSKIKSRLIAVGIHLAVSFLILLTVAIIVFLIWFPQPFRQLIGGAKLFWILAGVDMVCGPILTFFLFNSLKSKRELVLDLSLISVIQVAALVFGLNALAQSRPIALVFEVDRFVTISPSDIHQPELNLADSAYRNIPWFAKPLLLGVRAAKDGNEFIESIEYSSRGIEPSVRPNWWQNYSYSKESVALRMHKLSRVWSKLSSEDRKIGIDSIGIGEFQVDDLYYLPLTSYKNLDSWIVVLDKEANIVGYAPFDGFQ